MSLSGCQKDSFFGYSFRRMQPGTSALWRNEHTHVRTCRKSANPIKTAQERMYYQEELAEALWVQLMEKKNEKKLCRAYDRLYLLKEDLLRLSIDTCMVWYYLSTPLSGGKCNSYVFFFGLKAMLIFSQRPKYIKTHRNEMRLNVYGSPIQKPLHRFRI